MDINHYTPYSYSTNQRLLKICLLYRKEEYDF